MRKLVTIAMLMCIAFSTTLNAQCPSGELSGTVFQDFNFDGVDNDNGVGVFGAKVYIFSSTGAVDSATTASDGSYAFSGLTDGGDYRVEFHPPSVFLESSFFADAKSTVQYVSVPNCAVDQGFAAAADFCQQNPLVITPCFINGDPSLGGTSDTVAIVAFPYAASGAGQTDNIGIANTSEVGSCWGVAYQRQTNTMFATAVLRRHAGFGPDGTGAIYVYDITDPMNSSQVHTIDLDALGFNTGTDPRIVAPLPANLIEPSHDVDAYSLVGKMSLGDLEVSDDGKYLYVVNLFDRTIYEIFIDNPFVAPTAADVTAIPLSDPGCGNNDWRPWGLDYYQGELYAGMVCTAASSGLASDLHAYVQKYNTGTNMWEAVFDMPLDYTRGYTIASAPTKNTWNPWSDDYTDAFDIQNFNMNYAQPILSDIEFDIDGSMVLGFMDRLGMQGGFENYLPDVTNNGFVSTFSAGDVIRVCKVNGNFVLEGTAGACQNAMGTGNMEGPNGSEYYWDDRYENSLNNANPFETHQETSLGGLFIRPGSGEVAATHFDPINFNTGGVAYFDNTTGARTHHYEVFPALPGYAGKSAGLGVLMANCDQAPVEKGNYVWIDTNEDGIQDAGEPALPNINVAIYSVQGNNCTQLATTMTDVNGEYYFNDNNVMAGLSADTDYYIVVGEGQFNANTMMLNDSLALTMDKVGTWRNPDLNDSDGILIGGPTCFDGIPHAATLTGLAGANHRCDFGFILMPCDIMITNTAETDETCDGAADGAFTVTATSSDPSGIQYSINGGPVQASATFSNLAPGNYIVRAEVIADATCFAEAMVTIQPGLAVPAPIAVLPFEICQFETVPLGGGLAAVCAPCPSGIPTVSWYAAATGGSAIGTGITFDPTLNGYVNTAVVGSTTFYAECGCGPCVGPRVPTVFTVNPLPTPEIMGDSLPCPDTEATYSVALNAGSTYMWSLSGGGVITSTNANEVTITWGDDALNSPYFIYVKETDANGCMGFDTLAACIRDITLICDDNIQVSLGADCMASVSFDMLLEGTYKTTDGFTVSFTDSTGAVVSSDTTIGACGTFYYTVTEPCLGNSCWGNINVEDKTGPIINCQPLTFPCIYTDTSAVIPYLGNNPLFVQITGGLGGVTITDNCGIEDVWYSDQYFQFDCDTLQGTLAGKLIRTWYATDTKGNSAICTQEISFTRFNITNVVWPNDTIVSCTPGNISPDLTGTPTVLGVPAWPNVGFCNFEVTYTDEALPECDGTTKYLRTWLVIDWCLPLSQGGLFPNPLTYVQRIAVMDSVGPVFDCPADLTVTAVADCLAELDLPDVIVTDACSRIASARAVVNGEVIIGTLEDFTGNNLWNPDTLASFGVVTGLPAGDHIVTYYVTDDCGNSSSCTFTCSVGDEVPPTAICDAHTQVALGSDGMSFVPASVFDDGSFDNCGDVYFKVRRMQQNSCTSWNDDFFNDETKFCCTDIGDTITVVFRVYDIEPDAGLVSENHRSGHFDDCMVTVTAVDKIFPHLQCPADVTTDCQSLDATLWAYGQPDAVDNCALDKVLEHKLYNNYDSLCKTGTILRRFTAYDVHGNTRSCTQRVTVTRDSDFWIQFPDDMTVTECDGTGNYGEPTVSGNLCGQIGKGYTDEIITLVPDACYKILRTWRVEDGCLYDPNGSPQSIFNPVNTNDGVQVHSANYNNYAFEYTQVIKVIDNQDPIITTCPVGTMVIEDMTDNDPFYWNDVAYWDAVHQTHDLCETTADVSIMAFDSCSGTNLTGFYTLQLDLNNDGITETTLYSGQVGAPVLQKAVIGNQVRFAINPAFRFPHGKHKIQWTITDGCGNETFCKYNLEIVDGKKPTVVCKNGITAEIMQTGMLTLPYHAFLEYGIDNCTPANQLEYAIRIQGTGTGWPTADELDFDCNTLGTNFVELWSRDKAGNADFCVGYVIIQDNMGACSNTFATVAGALMTSDIEGVEDAFVEITGDNGILPVPGVMTSADGNYNFNAVPMGDDYVIVPEKTNDWTNGVNTYDLLKIQKHLLGTETFDSPYKIIAADANRSGSITPSDIIELRKLILGIIQELPNNNTSWRFVDESYVFSNPGNPFADAFPETLNYGDLQSHVTSGDFTSIKIGDINGSAKANSNVIPSDRTADASLVFDFEKTEVKAGETFTLDFSNADFATIEGMQFSLKFDANVLTFNDLTVGDLPQMDITNFATQNLVNGLLGISWSANGGATKGDNAFSMTFTAQKNAKLSDLIQISHSILHAEAYTTADEYMDVALRFGNEQITGAGFELYQNRPNPFTSKTIVGFNLPSASAARLTVFDITGREIYTIAGDFAKGYNAIQLDATRLPTEGAMFYTIETAFGTAERKMIRN